MKIKIVKEKLVNNELHLTLEGEMTVYSVAKLKEILLKELKSHSGMVMNLAGVDEADTSGFQLLLFLRREAETMGKSFRIVKASHRIKSIFTLYKENI